jgi:rare lipoprotein A
MQRGHLWPSREQRLKRITYFHRSTRTIRSLGLLPVLAASSLLLGGCGLSPSISKLVDTGTGTSASPRLYSEGDRIPKGGGVYKTGSPYKVSGQWYTPREQPNYDEVGIASWYGSDFHGRKTANGEIYDMNALTAAHPTLPIPSYAYVTNLQNGRTILVRINDRGPYVANRIIDLSRRSAQELGYHGRGLARVRVRYAGPAPLDGYDGDERQFLARANHRSSSPRLAEAAPPPMRAANATGSIPRAVESGDTWSPTAYRAGLSGGGQGMSASYR